MQVVVWALNVVTRWQPGPYRTRDGEGCLAGQAERTHYHSLPQVERTHYQQARKVLGLLREVPGEELLVSGGE